ncbi:hypothetical protein [Streptomyces sp. NPDC014733]|uniref:hypothetical protein n=1 Tax=Streptomyces sp. NPDC014733 TaxID=3364885 RepID=UPI003700EEEC
MPILWALANPKLDEREVLTAMLDREPDAVTGRSGLLLIADKGFASKEFESDLTLRRAQLLQPDFRGRRCPRRPTCPRVGRSDLAQPQDRTAGDAVSDRLRPLITSE